MKKGLTLIELVVVLVVIAIIASLAIPSFKGIIRNTYISEVYGMASLIISGARYYDFKYDFDNFDATDPSQYWGALNVNIPNNAKCRYEITGGAHATKLLTIYSTPPGTAETWLYKYTLPSGGGAGDGVNSANPDSKYVEPIS